MSYYCHSVQKWYLLFALLVLFSNLFAQNERFSNDFQASLRHTINKVENRIADRSGVSALKSGMMDAAGIAAQEVDEFAAIQRYDSIYYWTWDTVGVRWKYYIKDIDVVYNVSNLMTNYSRLMWYNNAWIRNTQGIMEYDANNNLTCHRISFWREGRWQEEMKYIYTYDAQDNRTSSSMQMKSVDRWGAFNQTLYEYDENNRLISETFQEWQAGVWVNSRQTMYYYNDLNNDSLRFYQNWTGNSWYDGSKIIYTYDAHHRLINELERYQISEGWFDSGQHLYSYDDSNNTIMDLHQWIEGNSITDSYKVIYTYDANNNLIYELAENWNGSVWRKTSQGSYTYDENNIKVGRSHKSYDTRGKISSGDSIYHYYKTGYSGIDETLEGDISLFPNPGNGKFTISGKNSLNAIEVYSLQGVRIYADFQMIQPYPKKIDLSHMPKGIYIIKITSGTRIQSSKIIIH